MLKHKSKKTGKHTTILDTGFGAEILKKIKRCQSITKLILGVIVPARRARAQYSAKIVLVGIELTIFGNGLKQYIFIHTKDSQATALELGLILKSPKIKAKSVKRE